MGKIKYMEIENIRDADDLIHEVVEQSLAALTSELLKSEFPQTGLALTSLAAKTNFLKTAIFDLCENDDPYSAGILFRSLIEHSLRHLYMFIRYAIDKSDAVGQEYYKYGNLGEERDYLKSIKSANNLIDVNFSEFNVWEEIKKIRTDLAGVDVGTLEKLVGQFQYKNIIKYLAVNIKEASVLEFSQKLILNYSELSSFVHGGPSAEREMLKNSKEDLRFKSLVNTAELTFAISKNIKLHTYLFAYQIDRKYGVFYNRINKIKIDAS